MPPATPSADPGAKPGARPPLVPSPTAWFLGPKAENRAHLTDLVTLAIDRHSQFRTRYQPTDPAFATPRQLNGAAHRATCQRTAEELAHVLDELGRSVPLASYRNQSHMFWDITLPAAAGYFAGMLFNQNNVAAEASPVTTAMEIEVAQQLCAMLGYGPGRQGDAGAPQPWGHITCDGSVANAEAMWAARNLRYHPVAVAAALEEDTRLAPSRDVTLRTGDGRRLRLLDMTRWEQMNLPLGQALGLVARVAEVGGLPEAMVAEAVAAFSVQSLGLLEMHRRYLATVPQTPVVLVPASAHYSWAKGGALLGLGLQAVRTIPIDAEGRMRLPLLRAELEQALRQHRPVLQVVAVTGTTTEGAVDPLADIASIRDEYGERGLTFALHADAAWGGYFAAMLRPPRANAPDDPLQTIGFDPCPEEALGDHARRHLAALSQADTITVDPHKAGFVPYPAGALCYRDGRMTSLISVTAPVVFHDGAAPTVGSYGIEGSKPGAAAVATLMSHRVIPPDASGYGRLLGRCIFGAKRFYAAVVTLGDGGDGGNGDAPYRIIPVIRLPAERRGATAAEVRAERVLIRNRIVPPENAALMQALDSDPALKALFRDLGPDLTVFAYLANFRHAGGWNRDPALMNEVNRAVYRRLSLDVDEGKSPPDRPMFVTESSYAPGITGAGFVADLAARAGVDPGPDQPLRFLISTIQNPWITATAKGSMIPVLTTVLDTALRAAVDEVIARHGLTPHSPAKG